MEIKIKKLHPDAVIPKQGTSGSAAFDLTLIGKDIIARHPDGPNLVVYHTGIAVEIPPGYVGLLFPRSSIYKAHARLTNGVGVIDSDYRGEVMAVFDEYAQENCYGFGDRFAQLMIVPVPGVTYAETDELSETSRGTGGYGSTGR